MKNFNEIKPKKPKERIIILDFIRGIALFGIFIVNISFMNSPFVTQISEYKFWYDSFNLTIHWLIKFFFEGNFYVLFSILFGIGFYLFLQKSDIEYKKVVSFYNRRLFILFIFGIFHIVFIWNGDILAGYAILGFTMLFFRKFSTKTLMVLSAILLILPIVINGLIIFSVDFIMKVPEVSSEITNTIDLQQKEYDELFEKAIRIYSSGTFFEIIGIRLLEYVHILPGVVFFYPNVLAMFLLGFIFARKGYLFEPEKYREFFKKLLFWCLPFAIAGKFINAHFSKTVSILNPNMELLYILTGHAIGGVAFALSIIALIVLFYNTNLIKTLTKYIAPVGRMALTNYLSQSIICSILFLSYGFGLYAKINFWQGVIIVVLVYIFQVIWSNYWLKYFKYGPLEWLWRKGTYLK